jgi:tRNA(Ile)-lysidine synthase
MYKKYKEKYGNNFEYVARKIRYDFYNKICVKLGIKTVLLAHHLDDFLETCIMQEQQNKFRLYYGMHSKSKYEDINILRPFLKAKMRKKQIQDLCIKEKIPFGIDETNFDTKYTRNKIRKQITDLDEKEYEKILDKFLLFNQKHNLKYLKTINLFNK